MIEAHARDFAGDRRRDRTESTLQALTRLLEAARRRASLDAVAVSDASGLLLAGAGASQLCEELAAWAPLVAQRADNDILPSALDWFESRTRLQRLSIDGLEVVVTLCGVDACESTELEAVAAGCSRILGQRPIR
jgi:hypothetical protein